MPTTPAVSIVLPVRNAEHTLKNALQSCIEQTFTNFEIVVVDDGSDDQSGALADSAALGDSRIRVIHFTQPRGLVPALQRGCAEARGPLIARMDADDCSHPLRLERQTALLEEQPQAAVCTCRVKITSDDDDQEPQDGFRRYAEWINGLNTPADIARERFIESPVVHPSVLMRREFLSQVGGYRDTQWAEDYDLWLRMLDAGYAFIKVPEVLLEWRDTAQRLTRTAPQYSIKNFLRAKAHYLADQPGVRIHGISLCGAGPIGKRLALCLQQEGVKVQAFYEVHPRRLGRHIHGVPVVSHEQMKPDGPILVSAVGLPGGRDRVRKLAMEAGFTEGRDFWCAA